MHCGRRRAGRRRARGGELRAFENRCLHQDSLLAGGIVRNGVLSCPLHFWRYRVDDGSLIGSKRSLPRFPIDVVDGEAFVLLPDADLKRAPTTRDRGSSNDERDKGVGARQADHHDGGPQTTTMQSLSETCALISLRISGPDTAEYAR